MAKPCCYEELEPGKIDELNNLVSHVAKPCCYEELEPGQLTAVLAPTPHNTLRTAVGSEDAEKQAYGVN